MQDFAHAGCVQARLAIAARKLYENRLITGEKVGSLMEPEDGTLLWVAVHDATMTTIPTRQIRTWCSVST